ncbi:MAG: hypothetical protein HN405_00150 [Planctomycetes bacterium]|jgi:hypothetical protein|nr:hypothetical protein [Planctomycetota bacterium]MBT4559376.1 hypothetical protein [Planctomycetota bacterium]MBT7318771.1 hypothetical protein [Planctomycetota bacterium]
MTFSKLPAALTLAIFYAASGSLAAQNDATLLFRFDGDFSRANAGASLANAGDIDGDGINDIVTGSPWSSKAYVYSGATGEELLFFQGEGHIWGQISDDNFGHCVDSIEDLNGDGVREIIVAAKSASVPIHGRVGRVTVYSGADGSEIYVLDGDSTSGSYGVRAINGGDIDRDGIDDILIGCPGGTNPGISDKGYIDVISGADGSLVRRIPSADGAYGYFGLLVDAFHDLDGDGCADFLVGIYDPGNTSNRLVKILSGATGLPLLIVDQYAWLGGASARIHDYDGDGIKDFMTRGVGIVTPLTYCVFIISAADGSLLAQVNALEDNSSIFAYSKIKDVNGDGTDDLLLGESACDSPGTYDRRGVIHVLSGVDCSPIEYIWGEVENAYFGGELANLGDITGDGLGDFVTRVAMSADGGIDRGSAQVFSLEPQPLSMRAPHPIAGGTFEARLFGAAHGSPGSRPTQIYLCYSLAGPGPTSWNYGLVFDLSMPIRNLTPVESNLRGDYFFEPMQIPPSLPTATPIWVQALAHAPAVSSRLFELSNMAPLLLR